MRPMSVQCFQSFILIIHCRMSRINLLFVYLFTNVQNKFFFLLLMVKLNLEMDSSCLFSYKKKVLHYVPGSMVPKISCLYVTAAILDVILDFERKQWFSSVASGFIGLSIYQNPYIPIFMLSARSEHVWHISAPLLWLCPKP